MKNKPKFTFRKHANIGATAAELDEDYLAECFVDTGDLSVIRDTRSTPRLLIGRTGSGKSALLQRLGQVEERVIELSPEILSLNYISNSNILQFFEHLGVNLAPFYTMLWKHVFTVELLRRKYAISDQRSQDTFFQRISTIFVRNPGKEKGMKYLQEWGEKFWKETDYRIKEFTTKVETALEGSISAGIKIPAFATAGGSAKAAEKLTREEKSDLVNRAQKVVSQVQIQDLHEMLRLLADDVFVDRQQKYFIVIDRLDETWVSDDIRYKLIRALIETVRTFQKVRTVKIVVALRNDLIERVYRHTRDAGFQEEKYEPLYLNIRWSKDQLVEVLDSRVQRLVRQQYTQKAVRLADILPGQKIDRKAPIDFIMAHTFMRPREVIQFLNECIARSEGRAKINKSNLRDAERDYSKKRLRSVADEWYADFPCLLEYTKIIHGISEPFTIKSLNNTITINLLVEEVCGNPKHETDPIYEKIQEMTHAGLTQATLLNRLFRYLYLVGIVGVKLSADTKILWSFTDEPLISRSQLKPTTKIYVHATFRSVLGIVPEK